MVKNLNATRSTKPQHKYTVRVDSSTGPTYKLSSKVEFRKRSIIIHNHQNLININIMYHKSDHQEEVT